MKKDDAMREPAPTQNVVGHSMAVEYEPPTPLPGWRPCGRSL